MNTNEAKDCIERLVESVKRLEQLVTDHTAYIATLERRVDELEQLNTLGGGPVP